MNRIGQQPTRQQLEDTLLYIKKMYRNPWLKYIIERAMHGDMDWYDGDPVLPEGYETEDQDVQP